MTDALGGYEYRLAVEIILELLTENMIKLRTRKRVVETDSEAWGSSSAVLYLELRCPGQSESLKLVCCGATHMLQVIPTRFRGNRVISHLSGFPVYLIPSSSLCVANASYRRTPNMIRHPVQGTMKHKNDHELQRTLIMMPTCVAPKSIAPYGRCNTRQR